MTNSQHCGASEMSSYQKIRYLSRSDVESLRLSMAQIINSVEGALIDQAHGRVLMPTKQWMEHDGRWFDGMASLIESSGYAMLKSQSGAVKNAERGLPYLTGMLLLTDIETGLIVSAMDVGWICEQRTAAASAIALKYLANPNETKYAMLGTGAQGYSHFHAFRHVMPALEEVVIYDTNPKAANKFARHVVDSGVKASVVSSAREAVDSANIFVTGGPIDQNTTKVIDRDWLRDGMTGISIDFDCYWAPGALSEIDRLVTDDGHQLEHIKESGYFVDCRDPDVELGKIAAGTHPGRQSERDVVVALNLGIGIEDLVTASLVYKLALEKNVGIDLAR